MKPRIQKEPRSVLIGRQAPLARETKKTRLGGQDAKEPGSQGTKEPRRQRTKEPRGQGAKETTSQGVLLLGATIRCQFYLKELKLHQMPQHKEKNCKKYEYTTIFTLGVFTLDNLTWVI